MATNISWTNETWNPIVGCSKISAGCQKCYAAEAAKSARLQQFTQYKDVKNWDGTTVFVDSQLLKPLGWKKSKKIFVCSMSDLFHENTPDEWISKVFAVMALCPQHTFQVLTKRPDRMFEYFQNCPWSRIASCLEFIPNVAVSEIAKALILVRNIRDKKTQFLPNAWIGVSVENQKAADDRIPLLKQVPAAVRFLSCEPLLGLVDLRSHLGLCTGCQSCEFQGGHRLTESKIFWAILGGESGPGSRPCDVEWMRSIVRQCNQAGVAVFVKQLGSNVVQQHPYIEGVAVSFSRLKFKDRKGGGIAEFPEDLQVREFPVSQVPVLTPRGDDASELDEAFLANWLIQHAQ